MLSSQETVFIFVAFVVVANLVSKHLKMKHEQNLKFEETRQHQSPQHGRPKKPGAWSKEGYAMFFIAVILGPIFLVLLLNGGLPRFSTQQTVFIFVAFVVTANLVSKHLTMKHEYSLKTAELNHVQPPPVDVAKDAANLKTGFLVLVGLICAVVPMLMFVYWMAAANRPAHIAHLDFVETTQVFDQVSPAADPVAASAPLSPDDHSHHQETPDSLTNWDLDLPFDADQYPSIEACAVPLARKIAKEIIADQDGEVEAEASGSEKEKQSEVVASVTIVNERYFTEFVEFKDALQKALKSELPAISFQSRTGAKNYVLAFGFDELQNSLGAFPEKTIALRSGKVVCRWYRGIENGKPVEPLGKEHAVAFREKPWLTDFHNFTSIYPKSRFHLGASGKVEPLKSKAHERAVQDVANRLNLRAEQIEPRIAGTFTQTIERPYGKVYREAILVQDPPVSRGASQMPVARPVRMSKPSFEFSLAMIVCLTVVAGFISNVATQGYYRTRISRTLMVVTSLAIIVILLIVVSSLA